MHRCGPKFKADCLNEGNYTCCNLDEGKCGRSSSYCLCKNCVDFRKHDDLDSLGIAGMCKDTIVIDLLEHI